MPTAQDNIAIMFFLMWKAKVPAFCIFQTVAVCYNFQTEIKLNLDSSTGVLPIMLLLIKSVKKNKAKVVIGTRADYM